MILSGMMVIDTKHDDTWWFGSVCGIGINKYLCFLMRFLKIGNVVIIVSVIIILNLFYMIKII